MALLIVFEGGEGAGKTTQAKILYGRLCQLGKTAKVLREPGGTPLGEELRRLITLPRDMLWTVEQRRNRRVIIPAPGRSQLVSRDLWTPMIPEAELLLFLASRAQLVKDVIIPSWPKKEVVFILDRFTHSTVAYQGYGRGIDVNLINTLNDFSTQGIRPDLVIFLDLDVETGLRRKRRGNEINRFEEEEPIFHRRVREGYRRLFEKEEDHCLKIDAKLPKKEISALVFDRVKRLLDGPETSTSGKQCQLEGFASFPTTPLSHESIHNANAENLWPKAPRPGTLRFAPE